MAFRRSQSLKYYEVNLVKDATELEIDYWDKLYHNVKRNKFKLKSEK